MVKVDDIIRFEIIYYNVQQYQEDSQGQSSLLFDAIFGIGEHKKFTWQTVPQKNLFEEKDHSLSFIGS